MHSATDAISDRIQRAVFGPAATSRLSLVHLSQAMGDGLFAVSLAGSLFFNVSIDAARPNILLYLLLTMAPFAVLAPLIGPLVDRVAYGYPRVVAVANLLRTSLCFLLAVHLRTLLFYPEALAVLVGAKTYSVAKAALVPRMQPNRAMLLSTNARLSRLGALGGAIGGALGVVLVTLTRGEVTVALAGIAFALSAFVALGIRRPVEVATVSPAEEFEELHDPDVLAAAATVTVLRAATGFLAFTIAFQLKRSGAPPWLFGVVAAASTLGAVAGTVIGPRLRKRYRERTLLRLSLVAPALLCFIGSARVAAAVLVACVLVVSMAGNLGRLAFDSIVQANAPDVDRGRAFARFETRFQLAWVIGAIGPVGVRVPGWAGLLVTAVVLTVGAAAFNAERTALAAWRSTIVPARSLPRSVLEQARRLQAQGQHRHAVLEAALLLDLFEPRPDAAGDREDLVTTACDQLAQQRRLAVDGLAGALEAQRAVRAAAALYDLMERRTAPRSKSHPQP